MVQHVVYVMAPLGRQHAFFIWLYGLPELDIRVLVYWF